MRGEQGCQPQQVQVGVTKRPQERKKQRIGEHRTRNHLERRAFAQPQGKETRVHLPSRDDPRDRSQRSHDLKDTADTDKVPDDLTHHARL